jgi:peptidoglycan/xylan/chitin deacetylase (PgdA/CDA1 family)
MPVLPHGSFVQSAWSLPVLTYHRIGEKESNLEPTLTVSPQQFGKQLRWLKEREYSTISGSELYEVIGGRAAIPSKPVLLTFDDAYSELCEYAFPQLLEYGFTCTVLVPTGLVGASNAWDEQRGWATIRIMSEQQLRWWSGKGIDFGSHTETHPDLTSCTTEEMESEFSRSRKFLEDLLQRPVMCLSYPFGEHNEAVNRAAASYFKIAFTTDEGLNYPATNPLRIRRTMVRPADHEHAFSHRVLQGRSPFYDVRHWRARMRLGTHLRKFLAG